MHSPLFIQHDKPWMIIRLSIFVDPQIGKNILAENFLCLGLRNWRKLPEVTDADHMLFRKGCRTNHLQHISHTDLVKHDDIVFFLLKQRIYNHLRNRRCHHGSLANISLLLLTNLSTNLADFFSYFDNSRISNSLCILDLIIFRLKAI